MKPFWVDTGTTARMAIVRRPQGGSTLRAELEGMRRDGVDVLVSMLPAEEAEMLDLAEERQAAEQAGIRFENFPLSDHGIPQDNDSFTAFLRTLQRDLHAGRSVAVHCQASIGRSTVLLASLLALEGMEPDDAFDRLSDARGMTVPDTEMQRDWVGKFARRLAG